MSDEKNKEKKPEEQAPKPFLFIKIEEIESAVKSKKTRKEITKLLYELLNHFVKEKVKLEQPTEEQLTIDVSQKIALGTYLFRLSELIREENLLLDLWNVWGQTRKYLENPEFNVADFLACTQLISRDDRDIEILDLHTMENDWNFSRILELAKADKPLNPSKLEYFGALLEKVKRVNWYLGHEGRNLSALAQALKVNQQLEKETLEPFREETDKRMKRFEGRIQGVEARFIQIIGIFAAIIAFIVTMVPTAVRLGGASIPVALAGLAIVTAGIIILLAMIFGRGDRREKLKKGFRVAIGAFAVWFAITIALLFIKPESLRPPPDPNRVDTTLQIDTIYRIDSVYVVDTTK